LTNRIVWSKVDSIDTSFFIRTVMSPVAET
jgi:hypothetical protein